MGASGVNSHSGQSQSAPEMLRARDASDRRAGTPGTGRHLLAVGGIASDRRVDAAAGVDGSPHQRDVLLLDLAVAKLARQLVVRGVVGEADGERLEPPDVELAHAGHDHAGIDTAAEEHADRHVGFQPLPHGVAHLLVTYRHEAIGASLVNPSEVEECQIGTDTLLPVVSRRFAQQKNLADLRAQVAACQKGAAELESMVAHFGLPVVQAYMQHVQNNAEEAVRRVIETRG